MVKLCDLCSFGSFPLVSLGIKVGCRFHLVSSIKFCFNTLNRDMVCMSVMKNPANLAKHQGNPKVAPIIAKMMSKFGGGAK